MHEKSNLSLSNHILAEVPTSDPEGPWFPESPAAPGDPFSPWKTTNTQTEYACDANGTDYARAPVHNVAISASHTHGF